MMAVRGRFAMEATIVYLTLWIVGVSAQTQGVPEPPVIDTSSLSKEKQQTVALLKAIETGDQTAFAVINPNKFIQHNLQDKDGLAGVIEVGANLNGTARAKTVRVFQDNDIVWAHSIYNFFGPKIGFDAFRFENGMIVEHWDNLQVTPVYLNPSGHSAVDGPTTQPVGFTAAHTAANKAIALAFVNDIFINRVMSKLDQYFAGDAYIEHDPGFPDGKADVAAYILNPGDYNYTRTHFVLGEGNWAIVASEGTYKGVWQAFYDQFRLDGGKIAEHWDVLQEIPPLAQQMNTNGKF